MFTLVLQEGPRERAKPVNEGEALAQVLLDGPVYSEVNYFHKFEDHISLKNVNVKFEFLKVILSLETMTKLS